MSPPVTLMALLVGGGFLILFRPIQKKSKEFGKQTVQARKELHKEINNQILGIKEIRAYGAEEHHAQLFQKISQEQYDISCRMHRMWVTPRLCYSIASALLIALAFVYSVLILDTGTAQLVVLVYIFSRLWPVFSSWQGQLQNIQSNIPAYETIQESIQELKKRTKEHTAPTQKAEFTKSIAFDHVGFTYQNGNEEVLKDICFELPYGSVTALVGPSGAGKSTVAKALSAKLGIVYVDTGALYRTVGYFVRQKNANPKDAGEVGALLPEISIEIRYEDGAQHVYLNGEDLGDKIRTPEMSMYASAVSAIPSVRAFLLDTQRDIARKNSVIMDGRDIGTVILPDAEVKIFMFASVEARAMRRYKELIAKGEDVKYEDVLREMIERDNNDRSRDVAPAVPAEDAVMMDNSEMSVEENVDAVIELMRSKGIEI